MSEPPKRPDLLLLLGILLCALMAVLWLFAPRILAYLR
jgi:hypothetical protein